MFRPAFRPSSGRFCYTRIQKYKIGEISHHHSTVIKIISWVKIIKVIFIYFTYIPWIIRDKSHLDIGIVNMDVNETRQCT